MRIESKQYMKSEGQWRASCNTCGFSSGGTIDFIMQADPRAPDEVNRQRWQMGYDRKLSSVREEMVAKHSGSGCRGILEFVESL